MQKISDQNLNSNKYLTLAAIIDSSDDAIVSKDLSGIIKTWNKSAEQLFGYTPEEIIGQSVFKIVPEDLQKDEQAILAKVQQGIKIDHYETIRLHRNGTPIDVSLSVSPVRDPAGQIVGAAKIIRDITAKKQMETKFQQAIAVLKRAEEKFEGLLESAPDAMVIVDSSGRIVLVNAQSEALFGYSKKELLGQKIEILIPDRFKKDHPKYRNEFFLNPKPRAMGEGLELFCRKKDGTELPVEISLSPLKTEEGVLVSSAIRDISMRKKERQQIESSLKEKEVLLREIHHRVKNNLQIITSLLRLQSTKSKDDESRQLFIDSQNRVYTMALLHELLYQSPNISDISLNEYFKSLVNNLFLTYGVDGEVIRSIVDADHCSLEAERLIPCGLIINELVSNSLKYAFVRQKKGTIKVALTKLPTEHFRLLIGDDGDGISENIHIEKTDSLGLRLVRNLARQLGGKLQKESTAGTCFTIEFPMSPN